MHQTVGRGTEIPSGIACRRKTWSPRCGVYDFGSRTLQVRPARSARWRPTGLVAVSRTETGDHAPGVSRSAATRQRSPQDVFPCLWSDSASAPAELSLDHECEVWDQLLGRTNGGELN